MKPLVNLSATFSRRELFPKIASTALLCFAPHRQSAIQLPAKYPAPSFGIGGDVMSFLKVCALTTSGLVLWLAPPFTLSRKIPLHNWVTGLSLIGGFACCLESRRVALKLAQAEEFESMREAVVVADAVDELATSAYVSEQQRRMEAESILNTAGSEQVEHLERSLALSHSQNDDWTSERSNQLAQNDDSERLERILQLQAKGYGKAKIILEIWGVTKGGSPKYKAAEAAWQQICQHTSARQESYQESTVSTSPNSHRLEAFKTASTTIRA